MSMQVMFPNQVGWELYFNGTWVGNLIQPFPFSNIGGQKCVGGHVFVIIQAQLSSVAYPLSMMVHSKVVD